MSGVPFQTKFTVGLLTIDPCPPDENIDVDVTHITNDVNATYDLSAEELAAQEAIKARKAKKKAARKARSASPSAGTTTPKRRAGKKPAAARSASPSARKSPQEEEAARKRLAELKRAKAEKAAELARKEKELAEEAALEEFAKQAEEAQAEIVEENSMDGSMPRHELLYPVEEDKPAEPSPLPTRKRPSRRISMFPATRDNVGLSEAIRRYGNNVPFDWEKEEWRKEHVNLKHTSTISKTYGWEKPEWARRSVLKKTMLGDAIKAGTTLNRYSLKYGGGVNGGPLNKRYLTRRHSLTGRSSFDKTNKEFSWRQPDWARRNILRTTEFGEAARMGVDLRMKTSDYKTLAMGGSHEDLGFEASFASLNASRSGSIVVWDKPSWAVNPSLRPTSTGNAVRLGADLSLPAVGIREVTMGDESARHRVRSRSGDKVSMVSEKSPNSSFADLDYSEKAHAIAWEKPSWTTAKLKRTEKGDRMKMTGSLTNPVTPRRAKSSDK